MAETQSLAVIGLLIVGLGALAARRRQIAGTTLVAPWAWCIATLATVALVELGAASTLATPGAAAPWRFVAALGTFCPAMALFGAKRPQDRAWQFIVVSLWAVLALPAFKWLLFGVEELHAAWSVFLAGLVGLGAINGLATRRWFSSLLFGAAQLALLAPYFPWLATRVGSLQGPVPGLFLLVASWTWALVERRRDTLGWDRVWLDFRDDFGVVWSARVAERINHAAKMYDWPFALGWSGFHARDAPRPLEIPGAAADSIRTLLRRFVSRAWIDARLGYEPDAASSEASR